MSLYSMIRPVLFRLDAETAHHVSFRLLDATAPLWPVPKHDPTAACEVMGLRLANRVGLAAGLDKDGRHLRTLARFGFGLLEIGTVTPRPQQGNPRPRLFRLPEAEAIINRMGFNNDGIDALIARIERYRPAVPLGINIGKNAQTPLERAHEDYLHCLRIAAPHADYITINVSSPNTAGLRQLQHGVALRELLLPLIEERERWVDRLGRRLPLALKLAPDLDDAALPELIENVVQIGVDALIATNTTLTRESVQHLPHGDESGGLSGAPLRDRALEMCRYLVTLLDGRLPLIASGGIMSVEDARARIDAGASLVQLYSGLIYRGPNLVAHCARALKT